MGFFPIKAHGLSGRRSSGFNAVDNPDGDDVEHTSDLIRSDQARSDLRLMDTAMGGEVTFQCSMNNSHPRISIHNLIVVDWFLP